MESMEESTYPQINALDPTQAQEHIEESNNISYDQDEADCKEELFTYIQEAERSLSAKTVLLQKNTNAASLRPSVSELAKRDSSIKKNSAFIKRLRALGASLFDSIMKECQSLNLSKYLSEAALAIVEARLKFTDIPEAVVLCTELNCTYPEFIGFLQDEFIKVLAISKDEPVANTNRLRVELCFYAELSLCGVVPARQSLPVLGTALTALTADKTFNTLNLIISFTKHCGQDFAGLIPHRIRLLSEQFGENLKTSSLLATSKQESVRNLLGDYYANLCKHIHNEQVKLSSYEKQSRQILLAKGELRPDRVTTAEVMRTEIQSLLSGALTLAELLDLELPDLPDTDFQDVLIGDGEDCSGGHVWDNDEARLFYSQLPDVKEYLGQLVKQLPDSKNLKSLTEAVRKVRSELCEQGWNKEVECFKKSALDTFLKLLPECRNKETIDNAALEFLIFFNCKNGRKKLLITLITVPRRKVELLPFYARFVAILNPVVPDLTKALCQQLKSEMFRHIHKKDQINVESKKKTSKFVGELVNFNLFPNKDVLRVLKLLLYDFTHHNIEMACSLLETCGQVLYAASDTHISTKYYLEQMMRLKTMMALDARYVILVENTYYHILPPESSSIVPVVKLSNMQKFIEQLIYQDLSQPGSDTSVLRQLRSLAWDCPETASFTVKSLTDASKISYQRILALAGVVCSLAEYQEDAVFQVVDGVLEDIRLGMELNESSMNQRRVAMIKYLGELYNYRLLDTSDILRVLYSLISFGVVYNQGGVSPVDAPSSVIRLHLILLLLHTCSFPLSHQETFTKLKYFFTYFQHYYWLKRSSSVWTEDQPFPRDIIYRFEDVIFSICPEFILVKTLEDATNAANNLNTKMFCDLTNDDPNIASFLGTVYEGSDSSEEDNDSDHRSGSDESKEMPVNNSSSCIPSTNQDEFEEEFLQELNKMFTEGVVEQSMAKPNIDIAVPLSYKKVIEGDRAQFVLLLKKGNKQTFKTLSLPSDHEFVVGLKSREEASREEKAQFKKLTLNINERQQEDI